MKVRAAFLVIGVVVVGFAGCSDDSGRDDVFDFATDSLCDWFTAQDMNRIVADAQEQAGSTWQLVPFEAEDCTVQEPPATRWDHVWRQSGEVSLMVGLVPVAWTEVEPAEDFVGHEMLDESITYGNLAYLCSWAEIVDADLQVEDHEENVLRFSLARADPNSPCGHAIYEAQATSFAFGVADAMLREMNWVG